jgi:hypothetical protein
MTNDEWRMTNARRDPLIKIFFDRGLRGYHGWKWQDEIVGRLCQTPFLGAAFHRNALQTEIRSSPPQIRVIRAIRG